MRTLLAIVISATIFWSAYWAIGAQRTKAGTNAWLVDKNNLGFATSNFDIKFLKEKIINLSNNGCNPCDRSFFKTIIHLLIALDSTT